jgi:hypothetical protein
MPRNPDKVYIQVALDPEEYRQVEVYADEEKRSIVNACSYLIVQGLKRESQKESLTLAEEKGNSSQVG